MQLGRDEHTDDEVASDVGAELRRLHAENELFRRLLSSASVVAFAQDAQLRYTWLVNPALGYRNNDVIGRTDGELNPHRDNVAALEAAKRAVLESGLPLRREVRVERDGIERWYDLCVHPERDGDATVGVLGMALDLTERRQAEQELAVRELRYRTLFEVIDEGYCLCEMVVDGDGEAVDYRFLEVNPRFEELTGLRDPVGRTALELVPGLERRWIAAYARVGLEGERLRFEDGSHAMGRTFDVFAAPTEPHGQFVIVFRDITERRRQEQHIRLLMGELTHRTKNILAVVQAVAMQTAALGREDYVERFVQRIAALGTSYDLVRDGDWRGVDLAELVRSQLAHFGDLIGRRIAVDGPSLRVASSAAEAVGMALHELATNACKYGSLSDGAGRVTITWAAADGRFAMRWLEHDGPRVVPPSRQGFGTSLIRRLVKATLHAEIRLDFHPDGLVWEIDCPLSAVMHDNEDEHPRPGA